MDNHDRADRAQMALDAYIDTDKPAPEHFRDMLCDLMHLAAREGLDFDRELALARACRAEELAEEGGEG